MTTKLGEILKDFKYKNRLSGEIKVFLILKSFQLQEVASDLRRCLTANLGLLVLQYYI